MRGYVALYRCVADIGTVFSVSEPRPTFPPSPNPASPASMSSAERRPRHRRHPETRKRMADFGFEPIGNTPEEFGAFVKEDIARWAKLVKETGAKVE